MIVFSFFLSCFCLAEDIKQEISWPAIKEASKYRIEIAPKDDFKKSMKLVTEKSGVVFNLKAAGIYYWRIYYYHQKYKQWSPPSNPGKISVKASGLRVLFPKEKISTTKNSKINIKWDGSTFYEYFKVTIVSPDKKISEKKIKSKNFELNFNRHGDYYVIIEAYDRRGKGVSKKRRKISYTPSSSTRKQYQFLAKKSPKLRPSKHGLSSFATTSFGLFSETFNGASATAEQNSPYTIGLSHNYNMSEDYQISSSLYLSHLTATFTGSSEEEVNIPPEYGLTFYLDFKKHLFSNWTPYLGVDIERFSTFNSDERELGEKLSTREHQLIYGTFGASTNFNILRQNFFIKTSLSYSLLTQSSRKSIADSSEFSGIKGLLFLATTLTKNWSTHFLFKQHLMNGPTNLSITRYGFGVGYKFF